PDPIDPRRLGFEHAAHHGPAMHDFGNARDVRELLERLSKERRLLDALDVAPALLRRDLERRATAAPAGIHAADRVLNAVLDADGSIRAQQCANEELLKPTRGCLRDNEQADT